MGKELVKHLKDELMYDYYAIDDNKKDVKQLDKLVKQLSNATYDFNENVLWDKINNPTNEIQENNFQRY